MSESFIWILFEQIYPDFLDFSYFFEFNQDSAKILEQVQSLPRGLLWVEDVQNTL